MRRDFDSRRIAEDISRLLFADLDSTEGRPFGGAHMKLRELFTADVVNLNLTAETKDEAVKQLVSLLHLDEKSKGIIGRKC